MKILILFILIHFIPSNLNAGSFSEVFGSEGAAGVESPKTRSLSYSLQYLGLTGAIGYTIKQLHNSGFFTPFGFEPDYLKEISPLAYDKTIVFKAENPILKVNRLSVDQINEVINLRDSVLKEGVSFNLTQNQSNFLLSDSINRKNKRDFLIQRYFKNE